MAHEKLIQEEENCCAKCGTAVHVPDGLVFDVGDLCWECHYYRAMEVEKLLMRWFINYEIGDIPGASLISKTKAILKSNLKDHAVEVAWAKKRSKQKRLAADRNSA